MSATIEPRDVQGAGTLPGMNQFRAHFYLILGPEGTLWPSRKRGRGKTFRVNLLLEYPTYGEELALKGRYSKWEPDWGAVRVDHDAIERGRVERSLVEWNLHEVLAWAHPLVRAPQGNGLSAVSMDEWARLPPPLRKYIAETIRVALGPL